MPESIFPRAKNPRAGEPRARAGAGEPRARRRQTDSLEGPQIARSVSHLLKAFAAIPERSAWALSRLVLPVAEFWGLQLYDNAFEFVDVDGAPTDTVVSFVSGSTGPNFILALSGFHNDTVSRWLRLDVVDPGNAAGIGVASTTAAVPLQARLVAPRSFVLPPRWRIRLQSDAALSAGKVLTLRMCYRLMTPGQNIAF